MNQPSISTPHQPEPPRPALPWRQYWLLMRLNSPIGIYLLLWPTLWALWLAAGGIPSIKNLIIFVLGTIAMRSAGCVINDWADRKVDGAVARTSARPLITGTVSQREAFVLIGICCLLALVLVLQTNALTIMLSVAALALAAVYPFMKRHTHFPQVVLGAAFGCGIPMAFAAEVNALPHYLWLVFLANLLWTVSYDTYYAMVDRDDDLKVGIKSTAIWFGEWDRVAIGLLQANALLLLGWVGYVQGFGTFYYAGLVAAALCFGYQLWLTRTRERGACLAAFKHNHYVGLVIFAGLMLDLMTSPA